MLVEIIAVPRRKFWFSSFKVVMCKKKETGWKYWPLIMHTSCFKISEVCYRVAVINKNLNSYFLNETRLVKNQQIFPRFPSLNCGLVLCLVFLRFRIEEANNIEQYCNAIVCLRNQAFFLVFTAGVVSHVFHCMTDL